MKGANLKLLAIKAKRAKSDTTDARKKLLHQHSGRRVLSIETQNSSAPISDAVRQLGLELMVVKSLEEANSQKVSSSVFDTVLIDQPNDTEKLRDIKHLRYTPVVLVASSMPELNLKNCLDFGIANVIQTPATVQDVGNSLPASLETSNRVVNQADGDITYKILLAEDSWF